MLNAMATDSKQEWLRYIGTAGKTADDLEKHFGSLDSPTLQTLIEDDLVFTESVELLGESPPFTETYSLTEEGLLALEDPSGQ